METATLQDFEALNAQLAALVGAGIPLDVGLSQREIPAVQELERINAVVARRVARTASVMPNPLSNTCPPHRTMRDQPDIETGGGPAEQGYRAKAGSNPVRHR